MLLFIIVKLTSIKNAFTTFNLQFVVVKNPQLTLSYIKSSQSIVIHVYVDFFAFFMLTFIALPLGTNYFNAQLAFSNTSSFYFRMPISLSLGLMTYVGGEMGNN